MSTLTAEITPGYVFTDGEELTPDILRLIAAPTVNVVGSVSSASVADGSITEAKLASSVVDTGMVGGGGVKIKAVVDDATLENSSGNYHIKDNGITAAKVKQVAFAYAAGVQTATVYAVTLSPVAAAYAAGMRVVFLADTANVGDVSLNVNGLGAKHLYKNVSQALLANEILAGQIVEAYYDGTNFQIEALRTAPVVVYGTRNLVAKNNTGTPNSKVDITADEVVLKDTSGRSYLLTSVNLTIDMAASGANGLDTGSEGPSTWYYLWLIWDGTNQKGLFSTSGTAPTLPANYTHKALVGAVRNDVSSNFVTFYQLDRQVWLNETNVFTGLAGVLSYTAQSISGHVPPIAKTISGTIGNNSATAFNCGIVIAADANGLGAQCFQAQPSNSGNFNSFVQSAPFIGVPLKTAQTFYWKAATTNTDYRINLSGYTV